MKLEIKDILKYIDSQVELYQEGNKTAVASYKVLRGFKTHIENAIKSIEEDVRAEIEDNPREYLEFKIFTRRTYDFKSSPLFLEKQSELKNIEWILKSATDMESKWDVYIDWETWEEIKWVPIKFTSVLTYTNKWL